VALDATAEPADFRDVPGVAYSVNPLAPALRFFECAAYRARISTVTCRSRYDQAQAAWSRKTAVPGESWTDRADRLSQCRSCPTGACHSGKGYLVLSKWAHARRCARCGRGGRIIGNRRCVSCYNRERERRTLKNARGNLPVELLANPLRVVNVLVRVDGGAVQRVHDRDTSGLAETMFQTLKTTTTGRAVFGFAGAPIQRRRKGVASVALPVMDDAAEGEHQATERRREWVRYRRGLFATTATLVGPTRTIWAA
jgi:hypothetical protein